MKLTQSLALLVFLAAFSGPLTKVRAIDIAEVKHDGPVDFEKEVMPILRKSCLACHNAATKEGKLVLETPAAMIKGGGEGPAVVPGKSGESLLLKLAAHKDEPAMPPPDNKAKAPPLSPQELGLLKLWIDQGAQGSAGGAAKNIEWQPLPPGLMPLYAVAVSPDGAYAAAARANQVFLYHVGAKRELGRLTDPALLSSGLYKQPGVAELDAVQALRFSPDGRLLATGGFRTVKLWRKPEPVKQFDFAGLESPVRSVAVSPNGEQLAVGEEGGKIKIYNAANGQLAHTLAGHTAAVSGLCYSADGTELLSGSQDKSARIWTLADAKEIASLITAAPLNGVCFADGDKLIVTGEADGNLRSWTTPTAAANPAEPAKPVKEMKHGGAITSLMAMATPNQVATGCADGQLRVWDINGGNAVKTMNHGGPIEGVTGTADSKRFIAVSANNSAKLFNGENNQPLAELKGDYRATLAVATATRTVALAKRVAQSAKEDLTEAQKRKTSEEENLKKTKEELTKSTTELTQKTEAVKQPMADKEAADKAVAEATTKKTAAEEEKKKAEEALTAANNALPPKQQQRDKAVAAAKEAAAALKQSQDASAKAKEAAAKDAANADLAKAAQQAEEAVKAADAKAQAAEKEKVDAEKQAADAEAAKKQAEEAKQKADKAVTDATTAFNQADQKQKQVTPVAQKAADELAAAQRNHKANERGLQRAEEAVKKATDSIGGFEAAVKQTEEALKKEEAGLQTTTEAAKKSEQPLRTVAIARDGFTFATSGDDGAIHLWDTETGAALETFPSQNAPLRAVAFTAHGVVGFANNTGSSWSRSTEWKLERTIGNPNDPAQIVDRVTAIDFTHDGKTIATGSGEPSRSGEVKLWSVENGQLIRALKEPHSDTVFGLEFSPDDSLIATCAADRFMKVFRVADASFVRSFEGHTHHVTGVSWRADGRVLASCGADSVVKVWDARSGDQQRTIQGLNKEATSIRFVAEGDTVVVTSGANLVRQINAANGGNVRDYPGAQDYMFCAATSADGKIVAAGGQDSILRLWGDNGQLITSFAPPAPAPNPPK